MRNTDGADAAPDAAPEPDSDALALLTIDLAAIVANWRTMRGVCGVETGAVVKADGYGVGALPISRALADAGCRQFFVATLDEAIALRAGLEHGEIAVLNGVPHGCEPVFRVERLIPVLNSIEEVARWLAFAASQGEVLPAMLHVDTGMNRLGLPVADFVALSDRPAFRAYAWRALISHFACSDEPDHPMNARQATTFAALRDRLPGVPGSLAATSGIFLGAAYQHDLTRPGAGLFGINPHPGRANPLAATLTLAARILSVRDVDRDMSVGYGAAHTVALPSKIATIAVGYADGYPRSGGARGTMYLGGCAVPVVGRISMDLVTLDVSAVPPDLAHPGAWVEIIGPHRTVDAVAADCGTIGYEILTSLGTRYRRHYRGQI
jgi:alanine racemase